MTDLQLSLTERFFVPDYAMKILATWIHREVALGTKREVIIDWLVSIAMEAGIDRVNAMWFAMALLGAVVSSEVRFSSPSLIIGGDRKRKDLSAESHEEGAHLAPRDETAERDE